MSEHTLNERITKRIDEPVSSRRNAVRNTVRKHGTRAMKKAKLRENRRGPDFAFFIRKQIDIELGNEYGLAIQTQDSSKAKKVLSKWNFVRDLTDNQILGIDSFAVFVVSKIE
jgi:hypothetical protein